jgi:hypothetical protein
LARTNHFWVSIIVFLGKCHQNSEI